MQALLWYKLLDFLRVQWRKYKTTLCWLIVFLIVGIILGIINLYISDVGIEDINYHLIDGNILNATSINSSIGNFIWQRILSIVIPIIVVLVCASISRITAAAIFPVVFMHGYWLAVAVWWTFFYYNLTAVLLLIFYIVWLLIVTVVLFAGLLWALQCGELIRNKNNHCQQEQLWGLLLRGALILIGLGIILGFFEYLVFWTVLGKIVYKPR